MAGTIETQNIFIKGRLSKLTHINPLYRRAIMFVTKVSVLREKVVNWDQKEIVFVYFRKLNSLYFVSIYFLSFLSFYLIDNFLAQLSIARAILSNSYNYVTLGVSSTSSSWLVASCLYVYCTTVKVRYILVWFRLAGLLW